MFCASISHSINKMVFPKYLYSAVYPFRALNNFTESLALKFLEKLKVEAYLFWFIPVIKRKMRIEKIDLFKISV